MATPDPANVAPWYLRNINQALALDETSGNVYVRTGFEGNIIISGNVNIPGNVDAHIVEIGTSGNLTVPWMPVSIDGNANISVTSGNITLQTGSNYVGRFGISDGSNSITLQQPNNDSQSVTTYSVPVENYNMVYNGTTWDRMRGNIANGVQVYVTNPLNANITGGNINAAVTGTVTTNQGTSPWIVSGNVSVTSGNITTTVDPAEKTAFQEPLAIGITPVIQADAIYGLDPATWNTTQLNNGNVVVTANSTWQVNSGTNTGGYARLATSKYMTYQPGQGSMFRWTAGFTTTGGTDKTASGIDNIVQTTGPIDQQDGYVVGYSGSTLNDASRKIGFLHRRAGKVEVRNLTITTAPTGAQTATITLNGVAFTVSLTASTSTAYTAAQISKLLQAQSIPSNQWNIDACSNIVTFSYYTAGAKSGTYSFSSTGTGTIAVGSFSQVQAGATPSDTWTYVDSWDNQSVSVDPTKLNVWGLDFRWLGAGIVRLFMEDPATGQMTLMLTQKWASTQTYPHLTTPSLRIVYRSGTTAGATPSQNVVVSGASVMSGIQGVISQRNPSQSWFNLDGSTKAKDTIWHLLSIQNPTVRGTQLNKSSLILQELAVAVKSTDPSVVYIVKNAKDTSDYIVFNPIPGTTIFKFAQYSVSAVTETFSDANDTPALVTTLGIGGSSQYDLIPYDISLSPGDYISVFISSTSSINSTSVGLTWTVD